MIATYELFKVPPRWLFLRVETASGVVGWGEPNVEGFSDTVATAVEELMVSVVGEDASRIQRIWIKLVKQRFYIAGGGGPILMSAVAGIDQALWDIAGKTLGVPVHRMLGGAVRERLRVYRWCGGDDNTNEEAAAEAKAVLEGSNFKQLKMNACARMSYLDCDGAVAAAAARMKAVREAVGPSVGIGLDFHGRVKLPTAKRLMAALAPYDPLFFEEVVVGGQNPALAALAAATTVPLATGERMYTTEHFRDLLEARAVSIVQPDVSHAGGISQMLTIARLAEAYEVGLAPHCPLGPIALASCMQVRARARAWVQVLASARPDWDAARALVRSAHPRRPLPLSHARTRDARASASCSPLRMLSRVCWLQVDAVCANFLFQETSLGIHYNSEGGAGYGLLDYVENKACFDVDAEGYVALLSGPGLGVVIDEAKVRAAAKVGHAWRDREWTLRDGTPTTW